MVRRALKAVDFEHHQKFYASTEMLSKFYRACQYIYLWMRMVSNKAPRVKITLTIPADLAKWVDEQVGAREYATRSHAFEVALLELKRNKSKLKHHQILEVQSR
jgi:hypothetical protein